MMMMMITRWFSMQIFCLSFFPYLQVSAIAVRRVDERANFEAFECEPKHPILGNAFDALKAIPARERTIAILVGDGRRWHVDVDVDSFIAVIVSGFGWH